MDNPQDTQIREAIIQHITTHLQKILGINYFINPCKINNTIDNNGIQLPSEEHEYRIDVIIETKTTRHYPYYIMLKMHKSNLTINDRIIDLNDPNSITKIEETLDTHEWGIHVLLDSKIWSPNLQ